MTNRTTYHEYRDKAHKWDALIRFLGNKNHITDIIPINSLVTLRLTRDKKLYKREKRKMLAGIDVIGTET